MSRAIPGSRLEMLQSCGHNVMLDQPQRLIELVEGFLSELPPA
jgi:pimeloyl-ACP methyl ester carboxylesterase